MSSLRALIQAMPKAELHIHIEGAIEPGLMFKLAARNRISLRYRTEEDVRNAYRFTSLESFLAVHYAGLAVLLTERDFYDVTRAYLERAHADNVVHAELFVSPQAHTRRGVPLAAVIEGVGAALEDAERDFRMTTRLIICIQRQWPEEDALATLGEAMPYRDRIAGVGLGGPELQNPPAKFARAFERARAIGWRTVAHAGEEGPAAYVAEAVDVLKVDRVDHGVRCEEDPALVSRLAELQVPLTVCPVSNVKLGVFPDLAAHNLKRLLDAGVRVTVNSDDPANFLGYINDNYAGCQEALGLTREDLHALARNSFTSAFLDAAEKARYMAALDHAVARGAIATGTRRAQPPP